MGTMAAHPDGVAQVKWAQPVSKPKLVEDAIPYLRDPIAKDTPETEEMPQTSKPGNAFHFSKTPVKRES